MAEPNRFQQYGHHVRIPLETHAALIEFCDRVDRSIVDVVNESVASYLTAHHLDRRNPPRVDRVIAENPTAHLTTQQIARALGLRLTPINLASLTAALEDDGRWKRVMKRWPPGSKPRYLWVPTTP